MKIILLLPVFLFGSMGLAAGVNCATKSISQAWFPGEYGLELRCDDSRQGFISSGTRPSAIKFKVLTEDMQVKELVIKEPQGVIKDYSQGNVAGNAWVKAALQEKGLKAKDVSAVGYTFEKSPDLYKDAGHTLVDRKEESASRDSSELVPKATTSKPAAVAAPTPPPAPVSTPTVAKKESAIDHDKYPDLSCSSTGPVQVIKEDSSSCSRKAICFYGAVTCTYTKNGDVKSMGTKPCVTHVAENGRCPTAQACAEDDAVSVEPEGPAKKSEAKETKKKEGQP